MLCEKNIEEISNEYKHKFFPFIDIVYGSFSLLSQQQGLKVCNKKLKQNKFLSLKTTFSPSHNKQKTRKATQEISATSPLSGIVLVDTLKVNWQTS